MNKLKTLLIGWLINHVADPLAIGLRRRIASEDHSNIILVTTWLPSGQTAVAYGGPFESREEALRVFQEYFQLEDLCNIVVQFPKPAPRLT